MFDLEVCSCMLQGGRSTWVGNWRKDRLGTPSVGRW